MWVVAACLVTLGVAQGLVRLDPLVDAPAGLIRGLRADDGEYAMFLGIPYAQVQEDNPFGASIPQPKFEGTFNAVEDSNICPQVEEYQNTIVGTLDCLQLNVYVPNKASSRNKLPVLVWIHGGGFTIGYTSRAQFQGGPILIILGSDDDILGKLKELFKFNRHTCSDFDFSSCYRFIYGPKYLVRHDVILVAINYRVGPYGFFCLDTPEIPGNQGLKDQVLALRWIRDNIASFGGDPDQVTVMGESAGGASVEYHLLSKQEKLFNQVITQSGSTSLPGLLEDGEDNKPLRIAAQLGFETTNINDAVEFLAKTDVNLVIAATTELGIRSRPCIEKEFEGIDNIITDHPINIDMPKAKNINALVGFNNKEQLFTYNLLAADQFKNLNNVFKQSLQQRFEYDDNFQQMEDIVRRFYIGDEEFNEALKDNLTDFQSDYDFAYPIQQSLKKYLKNGAKDVYHYIFSYSGNRNFVKKRLNVTIPGAAHADELGYLYDLTTETEEPTAEDQLIIDRITALWTNFVKFGDPTPETSDLLPVKWSPISEQTYWYLNIDSELSLGARPYHQRMAFWELFFEANKDKLKGYRPN